MSCANRIVSSLVRANKAGKLRCLPATRCRSTAAASTKEKEKEQQPQMVDGRCGVVEAAPVELISPGRSDPGGLPRGNISVDFNNTEEAYKSKDNVELLRSLLVFKLCTVDVLVEKNKEVRRPHVSIC